MNNPVSGLRIVPAEYERPGAAAQGDFVQSLRNAMDQVESLHGAAEEKVTAVMNGEGSDVHSAMIAVEKADLSFQLMMQVRNKIVEAYQEISRMQF
jgi:flagellar hook-basal body complex protein FliE